jgi:hypothetical protein
VSPLVRAWMMRFSSLERDDVRGLKAFRPLGYFEFNRLSFVSIFCLSYLVLFHGKNKKGCKCGLAALQQCLKVLQEQQTQSQRLILRPVLSMQLIATASRKSQ